MATARAPQSKSREQLMAELDERLKLNRGSFNNVASETGSSTPFLTNQGRREVDPTGLGQQNPQLNFDVPQAPSIPQIPEFQVPQTQQPQGQVMGAQSENTTPQQFLQNLFTQAWEPQLPSVEQLDYLYQTTGKVYGVQSLPDGSVRNNDGSITRSSGQPPMPIASMADGTILWSDGFTRERPPEGLSGYLAGVSGLSKLIFGQDQTVTQGFGNYNPTLEPGSGYNMGTDFRTRNLSQRELYAPVPMQVVQVLQDDGTRWGDKSGHQGYGNSVLVRLPSGEMLRLSHLSNMGQFQVGQVLNPGDLIGTPGTTGNTSGEHLDLEYYNKDGQIDNPNNFKLDTAAYNIGNQVVGITPQKFSSQPEQNSSQPSQSVPQNIPTPATDALNTVTEPIAQAARAGANLIGQIPQKTGEVLGAATEAAQPMSPVRQQLGQIPEKAAQTTGVQAEFGLGEAVRGESNPMQSRVSALSRQPKQYNPFRQLIGNVTERIGDTLGVPEGSFSETIAGAPTKRTNQALANEIGGEKPDQIPGIRQNIFDIGKDVADRTSGVVRQAGEGLKDLGQSGLDKLQNVFQKRPLLGGEGQRVIGEKSAGGDQTASFDPKQTEPNDIRDDFFKTGQDKNFSEFIRPENIGDGALSLSLFSDDFFKGNEALGRIKNVFGGSAMQGAAEGKFNEWKTAEDARIAEETRRSNQSRPSIDDYLRQGKTAAQWYAETGQQHILDTLGPRGIDPVQFARGMEAPAQVAPAPTQGTYTPQQAQQMSTSGKGVQSVSYPSGRTVTAAPNASLRSDSSGSIQQVTRGEEPTKTISAQVNRPQQSGQNIFGRAVSKIKNIFAR